MVTLARGGDVIHRKTFPGDPREGSHDVTVTHQITAQRGDNMQDFSCSAALELGTFLNTTVQSPSVTLRTFALPERPQISVSRWIEKGSAVTAICEVPRAFPAENVTVEMSFDQSPLTVTITSRTDGAVVANAPLTPTSTGTYNLGCTAHIFGSSNDRVMDINIYESPKINFSLSSASADLGDTVIASCELTNDHPEPYSLHISMDGKQSCSETSYATRSCNLTADRKSPTAVITCEARLKENPNITTTAKKNLTVYYSPEFRDDLCPNSLIWVEGEKDQFPCQADGNPPPQVTCSNSQWSAMTGEFIEITRNLSGVYSCHALNNHGNDTKSLNVTVEYCPGTPTLILTPFADLKKGDPLNVTCHSDGSPLPEYRWIIPPGAPVTYSRDNRTIIIPQISSSHRGNYSCVVTNKHGTARGQQEVHVTDNTGKWLAVGLISAAGIAGVAAGIVYWLQKQGKIGDYTVQKPNSKKSPCNEETPMNKVPQEENP
ncbi:hypothetical protein FKM82_007401 [Ascaphus truei]